MDFESEIESISRRIDAVDSAIKHAEDPLVRSACGKVCEAFVKSLSEERKRLVAEMNEAVKEISQIAELCA